VRAVRALSPASCQQLSLPTQRQQRVEQQRLRPASHQAAAELAQDRSIEPGVGQLQPKHILPVDAAAHRVGGPPIRQVLGELQHSDQREPPRHLGRLPAAGKQSGELRVGEHRPERVAQAQIRVVAAREGGTRDGSRGRGDGLGRSGAK
jgi:hypothetical protein